MIGKDYMCINECSIYISPAGQHEGNMQINKQFITLKHKTDWLHRNARMSTDKYNFKSLFG